MQRRYDGRVVTREQWEADTAYPTSGAERPSITGPGCRGMGSTTRVARAPKR